MRLEHDVVRLQRAEMLEQRSVLSIAHDSTVATAGRGWVGDEQPGGQIEYAGCRPAPRDDGRTLGQKGGARSRTSYRQCETVEERRRSGQSRCSSMIEVWRASRSGERHNPTREQVEVVERGLAQRLRRRGLGPRGPASTRRTRFGADSAAAAFCTDVGGGVRMQRSGRSTQRTRQTPRRGSLCCRRRQHEKKCTVC